MSQHQHPHAKTVVAILSAVVLTMITCVEFGFVYKLNVGLVLLYIPFIVAIIVLLTDIIGRWDWGNPGLYALFSLFTMGGLVYFSYIAFPWLAKETGGYLPFKTEGGIAAIIMAGGLIISVPVAAAFAIIENFFFTNTGDVPDVVTVKREKVATTADNNAAKEKLKIILAAMSETELQVELKTAIERGWYNRVGLISDALERFR